MTSSREILSSFSGTTPIFPLPGFVFFPKTVQAFQIFEPRYIEMVNDCMSGERLVTITLQPDEEQNMDQSSPPFQSIGTLGYLNRVEETKGGRLNIRITGLQKVSIEELESEKPYRRGSITLLEEYTAVSDAGIKRQEILTLFKSLLDKSDVQSNLEALMEVDIALDMLTHIVISAMPIPPDEKQKMLELQALNLRIDILLNFLQSGLHTLEALEEFTPIVPEHPQWN